MKISHLNKFIALTLLIALIAGPIFLLNPYQASAQLGVGTAVPVNDQVNNLKESGVSAFGVSTGIGLDGLAFMAANLVSARITDSIVSWINSGFQGSPAFITNPAGWFAETADIASGALFDQLGVSGFLCTPFAPIRAALVWNYQSRKFTADYKCKLSDVISNVENFGAFTGGDFSGKGGWDSWFQITQNPANNPYDVYLGAQREVDSRVSSAIGLENSKLIWGNGFLSIQKCESESEDPNLPHGCTKYGPIETPGSIIQGQLNSTLDSEQNRINVADEINEILTAFANQLVTHVFSSGLSSFGSGNTINGSSANADFSVSCNFDPPEPVFLDPVTHLSQPVQFRASVVGGVGTTTYRWVLDDTPAPLPPATTIDLNNQNVTTVTYSSGGQKTATVNVTKDTGQGGVITKFATCSLNVLPDPPLKVSSCSVTPSLEHWNYGGNPQPNPIWTLNATGGALVPGSTPTDMGYCVFDWTESGNWHWVISEPLVGTPSGSQCSLTYGWSNHRQTSGDLYNNVTVHSDTQTAGPVQCGPLTTTNS